MRLRTTLGDFRRAFFASLGLSPLVACGGTTIGGHRDSDDAGSSGGVEAGGASSGGRMETGGVIATGGIVNVPPECRNPRPRLVNGLPTGLVDCEGGASHRVERIDCPTLLPRTVECKASSPSPDGGPLRPCKFDSDCSEMANGMCTDADWRPGTCYCSYGCIRDEDCGAGKICLCGALAGECALAPNCVTDGDCASGNLCMSYDVSPGCPGKAIACQTPTDTCVNDSDCVQPQHCWLADGVRTCQSMDCIVGRPFLVAGANRVARSTTRSDWTAAVSPRLDALDDTTRSTLSRRWTEIALMEHASVAAFARFVLDLLSLGAPPDLLVSAHAAMADETRHARQAFALASAYSGRTIGPARLDLDHALSARSSLDVVRRTIIEGCIGETVAAVEAAEALEHAVDPAVRSVLAGVAADELRHAELAWRFVRWFLDACTPELRQGARRELEITIASELSPIRNSGQPTPAPDPNVTGHGILDEATRRELRHRVLSDVVAPCARALVASLLPSRPRGRGADD